MWIRCSRGQTIADEVQAEEVYNTEAEGKFLVRVDGTEYLTGVKLRESVCE